MRCRKYKHWKLWAFVIIMFAGGLSIASVLILTHTNPELIGVDSQEQAVDFVGVYQVRGPGYDALLEINKAGEAYKLKWTFPDSSIRYGIGVINDDALGAICLIENMYSKKKHSRLYLYRKFGEGLIGRWVNTYGDKVYTEKTENASELKLAEKPPFKNHSATSCQVSGINPNGSEYETTIVLEKTKSAYSVKWEVDEQTLWGSAFVVDDMVVMGYENKRGMGVYIYKITPRDLKGSWVYSDFNRLDNIHDLRIGYESFANPLRKKLKDSPDSTQLPVQPELYEP